MTGRHIRCIPDAAGYDLSRDRPCPMDGHPSSSYSTWDLPSRAPIRWFNSEGLPWGNNLSPLHLAFSTATHRFHYPENGQKGVADNGLHR